SSSVTIVSKCHIYPSRSSAVTALKLSVSDLTMLSVHYIQKGVLLPPSPLPSADLVSLLKNSLSETLSHFPPLAGRLRTEDSGHVKIVCTGEGIEFYHARATLVSAAALLQSRHRDVPPEFRRFFQFDHTVSYAGHGRPLLAVQVTELNGGVFIGCTANHAVVDGTSFWNFFNTFAEIAARGGSQKITKSPAFCRDTPFDSPIALQVPEGGPSPNFSIGEPLREKIFHFTREAILKLKLRANNPTRFQEITDPENPTAEISSFQSLCANVWRAVTRARNLNPSRTTTFRMAANCRHRLRPPLPPLYFGNAIQSIPIAANVGELLSNDLRWSADKLRRRVADHDDASVRRGVEEWQRNPIMFSLGNFDGSEVIMGSSPRFPMYDNDFGWGRPLAVRSGGANKLDGKMSAFPGREGNGAVDVEVVLTPAAMAALENDSEFMQYVS
ncbi:hypothetical protein M569_17156, partial [Genlisea aurea]